jgi:hypothetical protein
MTVSRKTISRSFTKGSKKSVSSMVNPIVADLANY